jgi:type IV fimbrial biogenesis protein FimT
MKAPWLPTSAGLTLLEVVIAVAVIAILGALALPSMAHRADTQRLVLVAETLAADLAEARFEASRRVEGTSVGAQPGSHWCWAVVVGQPPATACACSPDQGCGLKQVKVASHPGIVMQSGQSVRLAPDGTAATAIATTTVALFESRYGEQLRVDLLALGRARICTPLAAAAHPLSRYPRC